MFHSYLIHSRNKASCYLADSKTKQKCINSHTFRRINHIKMAPEKFPACQWIVIMGTAGHSVTGGLKGRRWDWGGRGEEEGEGPREAGISGVFACVLGIHFYATNTTWKQIYKYNKRYLDFCSLLKGMIKNYFMSLCLSVSLYVSIFFTSFPTTTPRPSPRQK